MNARRARQRFTDDLVARIVARVGSPGGIVARPIHGYDRGADGGRHVHGPAVVGHDQPAAANHRPQRLRARCGWGDARGRPDVRGDLPSQRLLVRVEAAQDQRREPVPFQQRPADLDEALRRPAPRPTERPRTGYQQHRLAQL